MDIFKQKRNLIFTIVFLVILNIITLLLLWFGRPQNNLRGGSRGPEHNSEHIQRILNKELGFNDLQAKKYIKMRDKHRQNTKQLNEDIKKLKKEMFDQALKDNNQSTLSDSLLHLTQVKQAEMERMTFQHFLNLKKLCNPDQQKILQQLIHKLFAPPIDERMPPPPPRGDLPPHLRN